MPVGTVADVDAYLARLPDEQRTALGKLRGQIRKAAPKAKEGMGYGLAGFYQDGPLVYYGAAKSHCAIYGAVPVAPATLVRALAPYVTGKGTLRFLPSAPIPAAVVQRLVKTRLAENRARAKTAAKEPKSAKPKKVAGTSVAARVRAGQR
jgi:uncharacterized protein YdhG (YjbR/CyaY superfamily)